MASAGDEAVPSRPTSVEQREPREHECKADKATARLPEHPDEKADVQQNSSLQTSEDTDEKENLNELDTETITAKGDVNLIEGQVMERGNENNDVEKSVTKPKNVLKRLSSSANVEAIPLPKVNCTEKIIFCIDHSATMFSTHFKRTVQSIKQRNVFDVLIGALKQFIMTKSFINKKHEFSLFMLNDDAQLITDFSHQGSEVLFMLQDIANNSEANPRSGNHSASDGHSFDLSGLFNLIENHVEMPCPKQAALVPPPYTVRVIIVYGRSTGKLGFFKGKESYARLSQNPYFFVDCVYVHNEPQENNDVTAVFSCLCELDSNGSSYIFEVDVDGSMSGLYNGFAKLLAHPLQRQRQTGNNNLDISDATE